MTKKITLTAEERRGLMARRKYEEQQAKEQARYEAPLPGELTATMAEAKRRGLI